MSNELRRRTSRIPAVILAALIGAALAACAGTETGEKEDAGEEIGTILGGIIGDYIPGNSVGARVLQSHGDVIGGLVGGAIGAALDEEDERALERSTRTAMASGKTQRFSNSKTGVRGSARVTRSRRNAEGQQCRTVQQEVRLKNGRTITETVSACKGPNGWGRGA